MLQTSLLSEWKDEFVSVFVYDSPHLQAAAAQVSEQHPQGIDMLLNNAGMQEPIGRAVDTYAACLALPCPALLSPAEPCPVKPSPALLSPALPCPALSS